MLERRDCNEFAPPSLPWVSVLAVGLAAGGRSQPLPTTLRPLSESAVS